MSSQVGSNDESPGGARSRDHLFQPGQSGNPSGRQKNQFYVSVQYRRFMHGKDPWALEALTAEFLCAGDKDKYDALPKHVKANITRLKGHKKEVVFRLAGGAIIRAASSLPDLKEITDRTEGKVAEVLRTPDLAPMTPEEKRARMAELRRRQKDLEEGRA